LYKTTFGKGSNGIAGDRQGRDDAGGREGRLRAVETAPHGPEWSPIDSIELERAGEGTLIRRHASFDSKLPGLGWLIRRRLAGVTEQFVTGLAARAAAIDRGPWLCVRHA
jgi:hypothetical protein